MNKLEAQNEQVKSAVDTFGRLSFMMETYVKLHQTGDHQDVKQHALIAAKEDAEKLHKQLAELFVDDLNAQ